MIISENKTDWKAKWIDPELTRPGKDDPRPASYLRKRFMAHPGVSGISRLHITAHGIYNVWINGRHIDGFVMAPGTSEYKYLLQYQTFDVGAYLTEGENEILASLGNGWWRGTVTYDGFRNTWGDDVALLAQLETDGKIICMTDGTWEATQEGPLRDTDNMAGEIYDARREETLRCDRKEDGSPVWHGVREVDHGYGNLVSPDCPPPVEQERFRPVMLTTPKGEKVLDFGQNIAGYVSFDICGEEGEELILTHAETLDGDGNFCMSNFQSPNYHCAQQIRYICRKGRNIYRPRNTFMGFRYVRVEGDAHVSAEDFTAHAVYTDLPVTASFICGVREVNRLFENALWSLKGNLLDLPTDCPTREKSGFTGDLVTYIHTFLYLMDCRPMVRKFICNLAAAQYEDGCIKQIAADPRERGPMDGSGGWSSAFEILPEKLGEWYGDYSLFDEYYEQIRKWIDFLIRRAKETTRPEHMDNPWHEYLDDVGVHWGEWAEPEMDFPSYFKNVMENGEPEVGTAYLANACRIMSRQAARLGKTEDAAYYGETACRAKLAYRWQFTENGRIRSERMCRYIRPIVLDLLEEKDKRQAAEDLNRLVIKNNYCPNTGFLTTHELCRTLSDYGYTDTAYRILLNEERPGWLHSVKMGATTIPENWDAYQPDGTRKDSFNHYSYGAIAGWLMDTAAGIRIRGDELILCPKPYGELGYVKASYQSPKGMIRSEWSIEEDMCRYCVEVPQGYRARMVFPSGETENLEAGITFFTKTLYKEGNEK